MADISNALNQFKTAVNGEDVRDAFVTTMTNVNNDNIRIIGEYAQIITAAGQVGTAVATATASATTATNKAAEAANSAATAQASATTASTKASQAADSAATATTKATTATTKANEATSAATTVIGIRDEIEPKLDGIDQSVASANSAASTAVAAKDATMQKAAEAVISAATATDQAAVATARATQAATSASAASGSELGAATSATTATQKATQASDYATAAATSATESGTKATEAAGSAGTAQASATTATEKAAQASDHATAAATSATEAGTKATEAAGSASVAQTAATTATTKAGEAGDSAAAAAASAAAAELATGVTAEKIASWDAKEDAANKGVAGGYAALDETGKVPTAQLPVMDGHTHTNKAILDKITAGTKESYDLDGFGDMKKTTYDADENGIVDNAEKVNGHTVESDVPSGAKFTDTTYAVATQTTDGLLGATDKTKLDGIVGTGVMTATEILTEIKTVDGSGSGLDADKLDGKDSTEFAPASHGVHVTFGTGVTTLTSGGAGTTGIAESLSRSDHTHTLPAYPDLAGHAGNAGLHVTTEKQTEWNKNTTDIVTLQGQTGTLGANDAASRREILDIKLKLDEMNVVEYLNKTGIGFFDLFEDASNIDSGNTTATMASTDVIFAGTKTLQMTAQTFSDFTDVELAIYDLEREKFKVDVAVNNSATISMNITPGSRTVGEKFYHNGAVYTITGVTAS